MWNCTYPSSFGARALPRPSQRRNGSACSRARRRVDSSRHPARRQDLLAKAASTCSCLRTPSALFLGASWGIFFLLENAHALGSRPGDLPSVFCQNISIVSHPRGTKILFFSCACSHSSYSQGREFINYILYFIVILSSLPAERPLGHLPFLLTIAIFAEKLNGIGSPLGILSRREKGFGFA